jgi:hypothetical protein
MTPIRNPNFRPPGEMGTQPLMMNNRPIHPSPLGKPPPHIPSEAPPISPRPQHPFGKLVLKIIKGVNLKAGQGVFGRADPYIRLKLGNTAFTTRTHRNGGKNPVSVIFLAVFHDIVAISSKVALLSNRNGMKSLTGRLLQSASWRLKSWTKKSLEKTSSWDVLELVY